MQQKTAILVAAALTAFVLAISAGVAANLSTKAATTNVVGDPPSQGIEQVSLPLTIAATPSPTVRPALPTQANIISVDRAATLALAAFRGSIVLKPPELVNFKGKMAYEVTLSVGLLYVDAFTGKRLGFYPTPAPQPPQDNGAGGDGNGNGGANDDQVAQNTLPSPDPGGLPDPNIQPSAYHDDDGDQEDQDHDQDHEDQGDQDHQDQENHQDKKGKSDHKKGGEHHEDKGDNGGDEGHED